MHNLAAQEDKSVLLAVGTTGATVQLANASVATVPLGRLCTSLASPGQVLLTGFHGGSLGLRLLL